MFLRYLLGEAVLDQIVYPFKPQFYNIQVGYNVVYISRICFSYESYEVF